jgi:microfibrillar-associated protein 1
MPPKKIARHFAGKAPKNVNSDSEEEPVEIVDVEITENVVDKRLKRLAQVEQEESGNDRRARILAARKRAHNYVEPESEDDRSSMRLQAMQKRKLAEEAVKEPSSSSESEESSEESDEEPTKPMFKPTFVKKDQRVTEQEKERLRLQDEHAEQQRRLQEAERRKESHFMAAEEIKREFSQANAANEVPDIDDTDGLDDEAEYGAWKVRELKRLIRDKNTQEELEKEQAEIERRRNMTDDERAQELAEQEEARLTEKPQMKFLQRYYHKGAFYQDMDILKRDYSAPTGADTINRALLPEVMQVKNFGKKGRTKYTHLADQDTSTKDSPWFQDDAARFKDKLGGYKGNFDPNKL